MSFAFGRLLNMCLALCVMLMMAPLPAHADPAGTFQRGFVLTSWNANGYLLPGTDNALRRMARDGSSHAAIFTQWFMNDATSSALAPDPGRTPSDAAVEHAAATARAAGMAVTLKPQIGIRSGDWIGDAHPADVGAFWADYRIMMLHYADLAEQIGANTLVIGTEMRTLSSDEALWRPLITELREHFHGALTYAANYDEFPRIHFWDALDYIGVDGYFALADPTDPAPSVAELVSAWSSRGYLARLSAVSRQTGKKVLFTELGYRGGHTTAVHPNRWDIVDLADPQAQANAYEAFYEAVSLQPWVAGVYWWDVHPEEWWIQDYSPLGKPAEQVMAQWNARTELGGRGTVPPSPPAGAPPAPEPMPTSPTPEPTPSPTPPTGPTPAPAPSPSPPPAATAAASVRPPAVRLKLRSGRASGAVIPYSRACSGTVTLRVLKTHGAKQRVTLWPDRHGTFSRRLGNGVLRVQASFSSSCFTGRSRWVA